MPQFSNTSRKRLLTCDMRLQTLFSHVIKLIDCTIICGKRSKDLQNLYYIQNKSKVKWPNSKHNTLHPWELSKAVDVAPYIKGKGIIWKPNQCYYFAGYVMHTANIMSIPIRWGGDWDKDIDVNDQSFNDLVHFELYESELCSNSN